MVKKNSKKIFDIITIFPTIFDSYFNLAIIKKAKDIKAVDIKIHDLRKYSKDNYRSVDDKPYGGGAGMIMRVDIIYAAIKNILKKNTKKTRIIAFSAKGKILDQKTLERLKKYERIVMICGRFEGIDERVITKIADEEISIGQYVLAGGEIPAMIVVEGITRLLPNVLGNIESIKDESFKTEDYKEYAQYTRPEKFIPENSKKGWSVPKVLLSGNHGEIKKFRDSKN